MHRASRLAGGTVGSRNWQLQSYFGDRPDPLQERPAGRDAHHREEHQVDRTRRAWRGARRPNLDGTPGCGFGTTTSAPTGRSVGLSSTTREYERDLAQPALGGGSYVAYDIHANGRTWRGASPRLSSRRRRAPRAAVGRTNPMMVLSVVERPEQLRPSRLTISPTPIANPTPCRAVADSHRPETPYEGLPVSAIIVAHQIGRCRVPRERLHDLSRQPLCRRVLRRLKPKQLSSAVTDDEKHK